MKPNVKETEVYEDSMEDEYGEEEGESDFEDGDEILKVTEGFHKVSGSGVKISEEKHQIVDTFDFAESDQDE